ncbi:MAG: lycopene cyclase domain-containing protein [Chitinophagaceae bacterium]|nr:lycopene cyclase domain-containing protein [Chitinophagaceae bacterium]
MKFLYLAIDLFSVIIPLAFSFHPKINFYKKWRSFFIANCLVAFLFIIWDILFTKLGVWGFNPDYIMGLYFFNLPIEEVLFFICIPFSCVFTYYCLNLFTSIKWKSLTGNIFIFVLSSFLLVTGLIFYKRIYTSVTFTSLAFVLLFLQFILKVNWLGKFFTIYPVLLIPFFIVNGILTGSGIRQPVVWYNNNENTGIRLFTIPVEDIFYGLELILLTVLFYEYFNSKSRHPETIT